VVELPPLPEPTYVNTIHENITTPRTYQVRMFDEAKAREYGEACARAALEAAEAKHVEAFMDGTDWEHHVGQDAYGAKVYPSPGDVLKDSSCAKACGVVRVRMYAVDWPVPQDFEVDKISAEAAAALKDSP
jgi:hypothetical protein